jgi:hypothetical protein
MAQQLMPLMAQAMGLSYEVNAQSGLNIDGMRR